MKTVFIYTGNQGFKKYVDDRKPKIKPAPGFKDVLADALARLK